MALGTQVMGATLTLEELKVMKSTLDGAVGYFTVVADTLAHNRNAARHLGNIDKMRVKVNSQITFMEHEA